MERQFEAEIKGEAKLGASDVEDAAKRYVEHCTGGASYGPHLVREAVKLGDRLLLTAGSLEVAMEELCKARKEKLGEPLRGAISEMRSGNASTMTTSPTSMRWLIKECQRGESTRGGE